jgi:hypothetical protein
MNKEKLFLFFLLILIGKTQYGQTFYFNKNYEYYGLPGYFGSVVQNDSTFIGLGVALNFSAGGVHFFKVNKLGDTLFSKIYNKQNYWFGIGASGSLLKNGNYLYNLANENLNNSNNINPVLYKFSLSGDTLWTRTYGGVGHDYGNRLIPNGSGFFITGWTESFGNGQNDFYLIKVDSNGQFLWQKTFGTSGSEVSVAGQLTLDNGILLSGRNNSNQFFIVKTDSAGNQIWTKSYTNTKGACFIVQLPDSGFILSGTTQPSGFEKGCLIKTDKNGNLIWQKNYGGISGNNLLYAIPILLWDGSIVCSGVEQTGGAVYGWLLKTDALGNQMWSRTYYRNQSGNNEIYDVKHTSDNGFIMSGYTMMGSQDPWLVKVDSNGCLAPNCNVGIFEFDPSQHFAVYPNPCKDELSLLNVPLFNATIQIFDLRGVLVRELTAAEISAEGKINISSLPSGLYSIRIISANQSWFSKVLKIE